MDPESIIHFIIADKDQAEAFHFAVWNGILAYAAKARVEILPGSDPVVSNIVAAALGLNYLTKGHEKWYGDPVTGRVICRRDAHMPSYKEVDILS